MKKINKTTITTILSIFLLILIPSITAQQLIGEEENQYGQLFARGDANQDHERNLADSQYIINYLFLGGPAPICEDAADANDDGIINIADSVFIANYLFGGAMFPEPFGLGHDPTADELKCNPGNLQVNYLINTNQCPAGTTCTFNGTLTIRLSRDLLEQDVVQEVTIPINSFRAKGSYNIEDLESGNYYLRTEMQIRRISYPAGRAVFGQPPVEFFPQQISINAGETTTISREWNIPVVYVNAL